MMDSSSKEPVQVMDNSDHGELMQWIDDNDMLTDEEKELYRAIDPTV